MKNQCGFYRGLSPATSIEQKNTSKNPRSTVATVTEIYDYVSIVCSYWCPPILHSPINLSDQGL